MRTERKSEHSNELVEREERLTLALWGSGDEFWDWDISRNELFRIGADHLLGHPNNHDSVPIDLWREEQVHPDDIARVEAAVTAHLEGRSEFYETEHRVRHRSAGWVWVRSRGKGEIGRDK